MDTMEQTVTESVPAERTATLTALDRCDSCGSQAYTEAKMVNGPLLFCAHHFVKYEVKLRAASLDIKDERWRLDPELNPDANRTKGED
jgi:hypothetical protein